MLADPEILRRSWPSKIFRHVLQWIWLWCCALFFKTSGGEGALPGLEQLNDSLICKRKVQRSSFGSCDPSFMVVFFFQWLRVENYSYFEGWTCDGIFRCEEEGARVPYDITLVLSFSCFPSWGCTRAKLQVRWPGARSPEPGTSGNGGHRRREGRQGEIAARQEVMRWFLHCHREWALTLLRLQLDASSGTSAWLHTVCSGGGAAHWNIKSHTRARTHTHTSRCWRKQEAMSNATMISFISGIQTMWQRGTNGIAKSVEMSLRRGGKLWGWGGKLWGGGGQNVGENFGCGGEALQKQIQRSFTRIQFVFVADSLFPAGTGMIRVLLRACKGCVRICYCSHHDGLPYASFQTSVLNLVWIVNFSCNTKTRNTTLFTLNAFICFAKMPLLEPGCVGPCLSLQSGFWSFEHLWFSPRDASWFI